MVLSFLFLLVAAPQFSQAKVPLKDLNGFFSENASLDPAARLLKSTELFVETPTGLNPLGEGQGIDPNPLFSLKKFDCTTFVETNLAIAFAKDAQDVPMVMNKIRYRDGKVDFFKRNHFMVSDWIPANSKNGFVTNITEKIAQDKAELRNEKKVLNKTIWFFHRVIDLSDQQKKSPAEILAELAKVPVLPVQEENATYLLADAFRKNEKDMAGRLPDVSIVMFIRNIPSVPTLVNHMGFVIKKEGRLFLLHAPQAKPWHVQELPLDDYFKDMDSHRAPVEGLLFLGVTDK
jgi:hypothetical protein